MVGIEEHTEIATPSARNDFVVYSNPVHKECAIEYVLPKEALVCISIHDVTGRLMKKLVDETQDAGIYNKVFDMTDLAQGVYFMKLKTEDNSSTKKIVLTR